MNADVQAVVIKDNFRFKSQFDAPLLRTYLEQHLSQELGSLEPKDYGVALARAIGKIRPELDVYLIVDSARGKGSEPSRFQEHPANFLWARRPDGDPPGSHGRREPALRHAVFQ